MYRGLRGVDQIATKAEIDFLRSGRRVELNAFTSDSFIDWIEAGLKQHGIKKVVPDEDTLEDDYRRAFRRSILNRRLEDGPFSAGKMRVGRSGRFSKLPPNTHPRN